MTSNANTTANYNQKNLRQMQLLLGTHGNTRTVNGLYEAFKNILPNSAVRKRTGGILITTVLRDKNKQIGNCPLSAPTPHLPLPPPAAPLR